MAAALLDLGAHWCILRTGGPRTLRLVESLDEDGIEAWTPRRTYRRPVPGAKPRSDGVRPMQELEGPILPTFVFARAVHLGAIEALEREQANPHVASPHPPFSLLRYCGAIPLIGDREIVGLREEESREAATRQAMLDAESAEAAQAIRNEAIRDERTRRRAEEKLERQRRARVAGERRLVPGTQVEVEAHHAFAGMTGIVESNNGSSARVDFGGARSFIIDAWRLAPVASHESPAPRSIAA